MPGKQLVVFDEVVTMNQTQPEDDDEHAKAIERILDELWSSAMVDAAFTDKYF
ncbi:MAG: hypothetical protein JW839_16585 [Candidatus Lokiarchaeota archaeon]|nr:hypothetical protein [Candidatus Lokiarchaeota archaeon]